MGKKINWKKLALVGVGLVGTFALGREIGGKQAHDALEKLGGSMWGDGYITIHDEVGDEFDTYEEGVKFLKSLLKH